MRTLICSETTTETNQQGIRIDLLKDGNYLRRITLVLQPAIFILNTDVINQFILQGHTEIPDFLVGYILDSFPTFAI